MSQPIERPQSARKPEITMERRHSPRTPVVVRVNYASIDALFSEFTRNINEGGLFIETETPAAVDTLVSLHFQLPGTEDPIRTEGRVVWVSEGADEEPPGMGVEFENLNQQANQQINDLVRRLRTGHAAEAGEY